MSSQLMTIMSISSLNFLLEFHFEFQVTYLIGPVKCLVGLSKLTCPNKNPLDCPAQLVTSLSSQTQLTATPYFQMLGPKIFEYSLTVLLCLISNSSTHPACHSGFVTYPKSALFIPFPVVTVVQATISSHRDNCNNFQYGFSVDIFALPLRVYSTKSCHSMSLKREVTIS